MSSYQKIALLKPNETSEQPQKLRAPYQVLATPYLPYYLRIQTGCMCVMNQSINQNSDRNHNISLDFHPPTMINAELLGGSSTLAIPLSLIIQPLPHFEAFPQRRRLELRFYNLYFLLPNYQPFSFNSSDSNLLYTLHQLQSPSPPYVNKKHHGPSDISCKSHPAGRAVAKPRIHPTRITTSYTNRINEPQCQKRASWHWPITAKLPISFPPSSELSTLNYRSSSSCPLPQFPKTTLDGNPYVFAPRPHSPADYATRNRSRAVSVQR